MRKILLLAAFITNACLLLAQNITWAEYYIDSTTVGFGQNTLVSVVPAPDGTFSFNIDLLSVSEGHHKLYIRTKDSDGNWSHTSKRNIEVIKSKTYLVVSAEYFFNSDPGVGNAIPVTFANPAEDGNFSFHIPLSNIPQGAHTLYLRARDSINHNWSLTQFQSDSVVTTVQSGLWSQPATWSNNKIPDINTVAIIRHTVTGDINGFCKSLVTDQNGELYIQAGKNILVSGH